MVTDELLGVDEITQERDGELNKDFCPDSMGLFLLITHVHGHWIP